MSSFTLIKVLLSVEVGLVPGHFVLDGDPAVPSPKRGRSPQILAHVYCGQTAGWIKMALGMDVVLSPGGFVFDGNPALPPQKGGEPPPQFSAHVYCGQTAGWINMTLGMEVGLGPDHIVLDGEPAPLPQQGDRASPNFRLIFSERRYMLSPVRLSVVCNVRAPYSGGSNVRQYFYGFSYTLAIRRHPLKISRT